MGVRNFVTPVIIFFLIVIPIVFGILGDYFWFVSLGKESVFLTILFTSLTIGLAAGLIFLAFSWLNIRYAVRSRKKGRFMYVFSVILAFVVGISFSSAWDVVLKYQNATPFGIADPVFNLDVAFFVFELPFLNVVFLYLVSLVVLTTLLTFVTYLVQSKVAFKSEDAAEVAPPAFNFSHMKKKAIPHLSFLLGLLFITLSLGFMIAQWSVVYSGMGTVYGAGYADLNFSLPLFSILFFVSLAVAVFAFANMKLKKWRMPLEGFAALIIILIAGFAVIGIAQSFVVSPNEFNLEKPFIERNIQYTRQAYGLDQVEESIFNVEYNLSSDDREKNYDTLNNIRLWDFRPLMATYNQLQLFRTYYSFNDIDIDRYYVDGDYKQVMISSRGINPYQLSGSAQTWVNQHLVYTHGYGVVANPVTEVTPEGLPEFYIKDIPPKSKMGSIERNEIYFGDGYLDYIITGTTTEELDYPVGEENVYTTYQGSAGVDLSLLNRLIYAIKFGSIEILFSGSLTPESRILLNRNVAERADAIAPFLLYDPDPYVVLAGGRLYWMLDAYTISSNYPYSQPYDLGVFSDINYVRNSVKVVVDAYNGDISYYVVDPEDPVIQTYSKIFPGIFTPFEEMPDELKDHIRYPEGLLNIQSEIYSVYHMNDPRVFYNKEDVWVRPEEIYRGNRQEVIPYYIIMRLPGEEKAEFVLILPFVPRGKDNLIGWMAARSDQPNYGKLKVFRFSKQELIYGPLQIEARVDQDTDISALFTLWSQSGSNVVRGNLLVIPVENSILYIEPVFLEATEKGTLPQLKRVIVSYSDRLTMQETLDSALEIIFGKAEPPTTPPEGTPDEVLAAVAELYRQADEALKSGDLKAYAEIVERIGEILKDY